MTAAERRAIAETYLALPALSGEQQCRYVRLADVYGVPFGRIVALTHLPAERVAEMLEEAA